MIINEHISDYIRSLDDDMSTELEELERWAIANEVPIIRHDCMQLLKYLLVKDKPKAILEIGTAVGFSTLYMYEYAPADAHITTIEKVEMRLVHARRNLAGKERITLLEGDALKVLAEIPGESIYDMIFMDAAKGQYMNFLPDCLRLLKSGGVLLTDNVLLEGSIAESRYSIERRDRTIHSRMREYLYEIKHNDRLETVILPVGDGLAMSYKR